jgi:hypothetical protein
LIKCLSFRNCRRGLWLANAYPDADVGKVITATTDSPEGIVLVPGLREVRRDEGR